MEIMAIMIKRLRFARNGRQRDRNIMIYDSKDWVLSKLEITTNLGFIPDNDKKSKIWRKSPTSKF